MELVQKFFAWREELRKRKEIIPQFQIERRNLTDAIKDLPESPHKHMKYIHYTNLVYQAVTGFTAKKLKEKRGYSKNSSPYDFLNSEELRSVTDLEIKIAVLIDSGLDFADIKAIVNNKLKNKIKTSVSGWNYQPLIFFIFLKKFLKKVLTMFLKYIMI